MIVRDPDSGAHGSKLAAASQALFCGDFIV